jgi:hypothetical protein
VQSRPPNGYKSIKGYVTPKVHQKKASQSRSIQSSPWQKTRKTKTSMIGRKKREGLESKQYWTTGTQDQKSRRAFTPFLRLETEEYLNTMFGESLRNNSMHQLATSAIEKWESTLTTFTANSIPIDVPLCHHMTSCTKRQQEHAANTQLNYFQSSSTSQCTACGPNTPLRKCQANTVVEEPGKDPRANDSESKRCGKIAQGASARGARHIHSMPP